ncbi:5-oxoprolinase subunit PxpB [Zeaxanthinibacter enoshimensis]|uniref:KipI family sensor histidine kinase inhibitor n=1 Tax=Zeaxanthinibacter enoshimensis TaxID=392009 RepID=A0A4R6TNW1_9FLAO|nr:5-oxoprolinase subunit PxpB [Zeaxanthinibacter enoshimensis]TDQ31285.1 KipI family sensor histidine kinase inhibitor [Zeaxanthinibacter enoshimensis]
MSKYPITIEPFGEYAMLIKWPEEVKEPILEDMLQFGNFLEQNCLKKGKWELVPAYHTMAVIRRIPIEDSANLKRELLQWYENATKAELPERYLWKLPVCYDEEFAPDLKEVSDKLGLSSEEVINMHTSSTYTVYGLGFLPGFMYLGGLPDSLQIPRREHPRMKVDAGSVGLAGQQTGIYPQESPGGWNIIGNCPIPSFDAKKEPPSFIKTGDKVRFYEITEGEYQLFKLESEVGIHQIEKIKLDADS